MRHGAQFLNFVLFANPIVLFIGGRIRAHRRHRSEVRYRKVLSEALGLPEYLTPMPGQADLDFLRLHEESVRAKLRELRINATNSMRWSKYRKAAGCESQAMAKVNALYEFRRVIQAYGFDPIEIKDASE